MTVHVKAQSSHCFAQAGTVYLPESTASHWRSSSASVMFLQRAAISAILGLHRGHISSAALDGPAHVQHAADPQKALQTVYRQLHTLLQASAATCHAQYSMQQCPDSMPCIQPHTACHQASRPEVLLRLGHLCS